MAELEANFTLNNEDNIDALFEIYATGTTWGNIDGDISNQTDLQNALSDLAGGIESNHQAIGEINTTIGGYGDIVTYNATDFATASQGALASTALQPNNNISLLTNNAGYITSSALNGYATESFVTSQGYITGINSNDVTTALGFTPYDSSNPSGYITSSSLPTVNNATITIQKNGSTVESFTLNQSNNETVNITVPTTASDIGALPSSTTIADLTTSTQLDAINSGATSTNIGQIATNTSDISTINGKIPSQASTSNQLADKNFVNSSIATNTAYFIGTFNSVAELEAYSGTLTNNDYAFVETTDSAGNTLYDRYKYTTATNPASWQFEYELNNSSFTSNQWAAINSGITSSDVTAIGTALQPNDNITQLTNNAGYITSAAISSLTDVDLTNLSNGEGLIYNATSQKWENGTLASSATWGNITGTLSDQTDLQDALDEKQNELIAGTNISITDNTGGVTTVTGTESVTLDSAVNNSISNVTLSGLCVQADTPTPSTPADIVCNNGIIKCNRIINRYGGSINDSGVIVSNSNYAISVAPVERNKTYTVYGMSVYALFTELPVIGSTSYNGARVVSSLTSITIPDDSTIKYIAIRTTAETLGALYSNDELIYTYGNIETITDDIGNIATAEMLLSVGNYTDEQSIIDGAITREVGVIVFDGTESWSYDSTYERFTITIADLIKGLSNRRMPLFCSHYPVISDGRNIASVPYNSIYGINTNNVCIKTADYTTEEGFKTFLAQQYQSGTPLTLVYPLDETTITTVSGQDINVNTGDNRIVITQSGVNNLPISATYTKYDTSTISFVNNTDLLQNTSTGTQTLTIQGTPTTQQQSINIGAQSLASSSLAVSLGFDAQTNKSGAVCMGYSSRGSGIQALGVGYRARATGNYAIQLGYGTNSTASTFAVGFNNTNYTLLDGTTGKIPNARLNTLVGADGTNAGTAGIVPAPTATDNTKFLRGDGTWATAGGGTVDQTYDATSTNAQSGTAVAGAISTKQNTLIAGDDIHFTTTIGLPYDYTEVASITNAATTYLNTGVRLTKDDAIMEIHFTLADASGSFYLWQQRSSTSGNILGISGSATGSTITMNVGGTAITSDIARTAGHTYLVRATYNNGNGTLYVKDETTDTEATNTGTYTWGLVNKDLHLFGNGLNTSQTSVGGITVDYMKLTVNNKVTFESCFAVNSSNVAGVYNVIARTFGTAGIGSVTAGAVLNKPRDVIYADGFLKNTATNTGSGTITIGGTPSSNTQALNIGGNSSTGSAYTVALGHTAKASGQYSTAIGRSSTASGQNSTALGSGANASGAYSTIVGSNSGATGNSAIAIGINAGANANYAIQLGNGTNATASTMQVSFNGSDFQLLDGTTGKIPYARLPYDNSTITVNSNNQLQAITRNIGEIVASTIPLTDASLHLLDGALISGSGSYSAFVDYIADLYDSGNYDDIFDTEANWQTAVTTYGVCGKFVYDSVNSTVRLPKITGITEGTIDPTVLGDLVQAGLPNITGEWSPASYRFGAPSSYDPAGALYKESSSGDRASYSGSSNTVSLKFDASRSNSIYGNSATVQPQAIKVLYYIVIATSTKTAIQVDIDEIATDLNGKMDTDGTNAVSSVKFADGQWVDSFISIASGVSLKHDNGVVDYSLSSYLPNDNCNYEVIFTGYGAGASSSSGAYLWLFTDIIGDASADPVEMIQLFRGAGTATAGGTAILPVGTGRVVKAYCSNASNATITLRAIGYRRIGTNA